MAKTSKSDASPPEALSATSGALPADFETAVGELEKIVESMESGELTLEQSLAAHKRGLELAQFCQGVLARAQQQVKVLEEGILRDLEADEGRPT